jgi:hypothetical protein
MEPDRGGPQERGARKGRYANVLQVGHNAFEFVFDFGQDYQEDHEVQWHTRIVTGPAYAGSVPVTCETPRKCRKNKRAFVPITRYRDTTLHSIN